ncbi:MAG: UvrB/UvrC motif-containing protein [Pirellulaceae bacterium]
MSDRQDIDHILKHWPFDPTTINVRSVDIGQRSVLQLRLDMGLLQMEIKGRPDGKRPHGETTYFEYLQKQRAMNEEKFELSEEQCSEVDREFVQYYHRRVCWLHMHEFEKAVHDANHTLGLMDFCKLHSPDEDWTISHEQYRPFVLYHRTQAKALAILESDAENSAELAVEEVNQGLEMIRQLFVEYEAEDQFEGDELVIQLMDFQKSLRARYKVEKTLSEKLSEAIAAENYELAAKLRDQLTLRNNGR